MKAKITLIVLLFSITVFGQNPKEGEIVISKERLISLLQKFKTQNIELNKSNFDRVSVNENESVLSKINELESQLANMNLKLDSIVKRPALKDSSVVYQSRLVTKRDTVYKYVGQENLSKVSNSTEKEENASYEQKLNALNDKYEELLRNQELILESQRRDKRKARNTVIPVIIPRKEKEPEVAKAAVAPVTPVAAVRDLVVVSDTLTTAVVSAAPELYMDAEYDRLLAKYGTVKNQVYFANNSVTIPNSDGLRLEAVVEVLTNQPTIDVFIEGFSSKKGDPEYNEKLSMRRTQVVKDYFVAQGIDPVRILSEYHGVDDNAKDDAHARRVDVTFKVRK